MIKNLNRISFSKYGTVLMERSQKQLTANGEEQIEYVKQLDKGEKTLYMLDADKLYLDFIDGMTVLAVSETPESGALEFFYLDKPTVLRRGVYFSLFPLFETSRVCCRLAEESSWKPAGVPLPDSPLTIHRQLSVPTIYTYFYQEKEKSFFFKGEQHEMFELTYVDKGELHNVVNGRDFLLSQGEMVIFGPNQWHMQYTEQDCFACFFTITFDLQCPFSEQLLGQKFALDSRCAKMLQRLMQEGSASDSLSNDIMIVQLEQLLLEVLRMERPNEAKLRSSISMYSKNETVSRIQAFIAGNLYKKLTVGSVAAENSISVSYMSSLFRQHTNISLGEYIRRAKLEESKRLIREGKYNFSQIAGMLHYSSVNHFSTQFKEYFGMTPSQYTRAMYP